MVHKKKGKDARRPGRLPQEIPPSEEEAREIFLASLEHIDPSLKDEESASSRNRAAGRSRGGLSESIDIDLHGLTRADACHRIDQVFGRCLATDKLHLIKVITGKGRHGVGVLAREIHRYVMERFGCHIVTIESSPHETITSGEPWRGHFTLQLRRNAGIL